ncbi:MAG: hypothetical protein CFE24_12815 [Flavobacterium sp. BFFFF2]|nr:MAG: hypothetical protein CFE24_12815 [Flavobacterium sp. BFFFF2]
MKPQQHHPQTICLLVDQLGGGGAERAAAWLSQYWAAQGMQVQWVLMQNVVSYPHAGEVFNLGLFKSAKPTILNRLYLLWKLRQFFAAHSFDVIVDFRVKLRPIVEFYLTHFVFKGTYICTVHSAMTPLYFPPFFNRKQSFYPKNTHFVAVHQTIADVLKKQHGVKATVIPNPVNAPQLAVWANESIPDYGNYWLAVGRLDANKQFDQLIRHFNSSTLPQRGTKLLLIGDGPASDELQALIQSLNTTNIVLLGLKDNPYPYMKKALGLVLCSQHEGLPTVILESLSIGRPVVSFDCPTGPAQLIQHQHNGLLIPNQDWQALIQALEQLTQDPAQLEAMAEQTVQSVQPYELSQVGGEWGRILNSKF